MDVALVSSPDDLAQVMAAGQPSEVDLSIVIPAYNEAARIERSIVRLREFLAADDCSWEIVISDDGSTDDTAALVERVAADDQGRRTRLVRGVVNRGKGAALRAGVAQTRGRRVLMTDADLATPIDELNRLRQALDAGADIAVGSRAVPGADIRRPQSWPRILFGRLGNLWIRALAVPGVHDTQCGFKLFDGPTARRLFAACQEDRFGVDIEVLCLARRRFHLRIEEIGVRWEHQAGSKVRVRDYADVFAKVPRIAWSVARRPIAPPEEVPEKA